jgi:hypothetical protein
LHRSYPFHLRQQGCVTPSAPNHHPTRGLPQL